MTIFTYDDLLRFREALTEGPQRSEDRELFLKLDKLIKRERQYAQREKWIVLNRKKGMTFAAMAKKLQITDGRAQQIYHKAMRQSRGTLI